MTQSVNLSANQQKAFELVQKAKSGDDSAIDELCSGIFDATKGQLGTNKEYLDTILTNSDNDTLAMIMDNYSEVTGSEIYKDIEDELFFSGKDEAIDKLSSAYKEAKGSEYTGDNDGKLTIKQTASAIGKGLFKKLPSIATTIGGVLLGKSAIGACISGVAGSALTAIFGAGAATVATFAAPVIATAGIITGCVMVYKGVKQTFQSIEEAKNATTDDAKQNAIEESAKGVIDTGLGVYTGYQSMKALNSSIKNVKTTINDKNKTNEIINYNQEIRQKPKKLTLSRDPIYDCDIPYQQDSYYRGIGESGYQDFLDSNSLRAKQNTKANYDAAYFQKGKVNNIYVRKPSAQAYIAETNSPLIIDESGSYPHASIIPDSEPMRIWHKTDSGGYEIVYDTMNDTISRNSSLRYVSK